MALTKRENLLETIRRGEPDRLVNQFEYMGKCFDPLALHCAGMCDYGSTSRSDWGFWTTWPQGIIAPFPLHDEAHLLVPDVTQWDKVVKAPDPWRYPDEEWEECDRFMAGIDRTDQFAVAQVITGVFEKVHYLMGMDNACMNLLLESEAMHELVDCLTEWEIEAAKVQIEHFHPDALFHHDDFGTQNSLLMSPELFREFFVPAYKKIYGYYRDHGVELIVHHSDSFAATLVPDFIDMGVDIWQGVLDTNDIPSLVRKYGGQISFQGGLNNGTYDVEGCTREMVREGLERLIGQTGVHSIIPALTAGGPVTAYPEVYSLVTEEIDALSARLFSKEG